MATRVDLIGHRFGRLTVSSYLGNSTWLCLCDCGEQTEAQAPLLKKGKKTSCGCYRREKGKERGENSARHGEGSNGKESTEYRCWTNMVSRCNNPNHASFYRYGARGIRVCAAWDPRQGGSYEVFLACVGRKPTTEHTLDRIDVNGNYEPGNCRWATHTQQARNMTTNRHIEIDGHIKVLSEWLEIYRLRRETFYQRMRRGMSEREALTLALQKPGRRRKQI